LHIAIGGQCQGCAAVLTGSDIEQLGDGVTSSGGLDYLRMRDESHYRQDQLMI
jgi:hypothetical protein